MKRKPYKPKKAICKQCGEDYIRERAFTVCCSVSCALKYASKRNKSETKKKRTLALKEYKSSDKSHLMKIAQREVNKYIRTRDKHEPCISCQMPPGFRIEAGHYRSSGNNGAIRFHTLNIHAQDHKCNCHMSANLVPYRENLIKKIGLEKVEWLESQTQPRKYTVEYLQKLIRVFRKKIKKIENNH